MGVSRSERGQDGTEDVRAEGLVVARGKQEGDGKADTDRQIDTLYHTMGGQ